MPATKMELLAGSTAATLTLRGGRLTITVDSGRDADRLVAFGRVESAIRSIARGDDLKALSITGRRYKGFPRVANLVTAVRSGDVVAYRAWPNGFEAVTSL